ncbi:hypothetical protein CEXT_778591 [Caerostris extrusa]|uniref:Uncharacterized protein n=1 Tax=Caerostris extrusa TaxID=172846 RepID=A0AAV4V3W5_CAEEX|nr:hypothetical protein CEXT_778591 [Caerostris extrusa]
MQLFTIAHPSAKIFEGTHIKKRSNITLSTGRPHIKGKDRRFSLKTQSSRDTSQSRVIRGDFNHHAVITARPTRSVCLFAVDCSKTWGTGVCVREGEVTGWGCSREKHRLNVGQTRLGPQYQFV